MKSFRSHFFAALLGAAALLSIAATTGVTLRNDSNGYLIGTASTDKIAFRGKKPIPAPSITALTENASTIGGTNNADLPSLTATAATVTGTLTGTTDGALADVAAVSTAGGNTYADSAINTAITSVNLQLKELQEALNEVTADNVALRAAARENATGINALRTILINQGIGKAP